MTLPFTYSTYRHVRDNQPITCTLDWDEFADSLATPVAIQHKTDAYLWNPVAYVDDTTRHIDTIVSIHALVVDFDNKEETTKTRVSCPVTIDDVEARLTGREYVIASSFSNTPEWPRFRLVLPFAVAVPPIGWPHRTRGLLKLLGLDDLTGIDHGVIANPNAIYYWSSAKPGNPGVFRRNRGIYLTPEVPDVPTPAGTSARMSRNNNDDRFTSAQIEQYYRDRIPNYEMRESGVEWRGMCPFHGGEGQLNFGINRQTGLWMCHSQCIRPNGKQVGGDIYEFEMRLRNVDFTTARTQVDQFLGVELDEDFSTYKPFDTLLQEIKDAPASSLGELKQAVAAHGNLRQRRALVQQLVATHQLDTEQLEREILGLRQNLKRARSNLVQFPRQNDEIASKLEAEQRVAQEVADRTSNTPYGLCLPANKYYADWTGVYPVKGTMQGDQFTYEPQLNRPIVTRPMWPAEIGDDVITGETYMRLCWFGSNRVVHAEWMLGEKSNDRDILLKLNDAPISIPRVPEISEYLGVAKAGVLSPRKEIASSVGWVKDCQRFVLDNDPGITYIGKPLKRKGTVQGWLTSLQEMIDAGPDGYTALCVVGLAAAAPLVRLTGKRNPIIGLVCDSSTGKGTILNFALAMWNEPSLLTLPAGSTGKGVQDMSIGNVDLPVFADEMQQLRKADPRQVEFVLYYLANGQRRITSSRSQTAKGGERRYGSGFFASEVPILEGVQKGVHYRVIELTQTPLPGLQAANRMQQVTRENYGQVGQVLASYLNANKNALSHMILSAANGLQTSATDLQGDDAYAIACTRVGLHMLNMTLGTTIDIGDVTNWLVSEVTGQRKNVKDAYTIVWEHMLDTVISHTWTELINCNVLEDRGSLIAFKLDQAIDKTVAPLEINPATDKIAGLFKTNGASENYARVWANRGWILPNGDSLKWIRSSGEGTGSRVWRVTNAGLGVIGLDMKLEAL